MKSLPLLSVAGIRIQIHWSFWLIIAWVLSSALFAGATIPAAIGQILFVLVLFACVTLHELGHAFAAKAFGIRTRDITLLPIGGVARLERIPRNPGQELAIALAGPVVNVLIAGMLAIAILTISGPTALLSLREGVIGFLQRIALVNIALVLFNLLPAFPLDGGRVFRACLASFLKYEKATKIAAITGQVFAGLIALAGIFNPMLWFIAIFIFLGAMNESRAVATAQHTDGGPMQSPQVAVPANYPLAKLARLAPWPPENTFLVIRDGAVMGRFSGRQLNSAVESNNGQFAADIINGSAQGAEQL